MKKKYRIVGILLIAVIAIAITISYITAFGVVSDAVYKLGMSHSGSITVEPTGVSFTGEFIYMNSADIPLNIDLVNITIVVYGGSPYDGNLHFMGPPYLSDAPHIGNVIGENKIVPPHGQAQISATFDVTSEEALNLIQGGDYNVGGWHRELAVSGSYLFWHFTPQIATY